MAICSVQKTGQLQFVVYRKQASDTHMYVYSGEYVKSSKITNGKQGQSLQCQIFI